MKTNLFPDGHFTQVPHIILREYMQQLTGNEFKVLMALVDETWGWGQTSKRLSDTRVATLAKISTNSAGIALNTLEKHRMIVSRGVNQDGTLYQVLIPKRCTCCSLVPKHNPSDEVPQKLGTYKERGNSADSQDIIFSNSTKESLDDWWERNLSSNTDIRTIGCTAIEKAGWNQDVGERATHENSDNSLPAPAYPIEVFHKDGDRHLQEIEHEDTDEMLQMYENSISDLLTEKDYLSIMTAALRKARETGYIPTFARKWVGRWKAKQLGMARLVSTQRAQLAVLYSAWDRLFGDTQMPMARKLGRLIAQYGGLNAGGPERLLKIMVATSEVITAFQQGGPESAIAAISSTSRNLSEETEGAHVA